MQLGIAPLAQDPAQYLCAVLSGALAVPVEHGDLLPRQFDAQFCCLRHGAPTGSHRRSPADTTAGRAEAVVIDGSEEARFARLRRDLGDRVRAQVRDLRRRAARMQAPDALAHRAPVRAAVARAEDAGREGGQVGGVGGVGHDESKSWFTPWRHWRLTSDWRTSFTTTVWVINRVHYRTTN